MSAPIYKILPASEWEAAQAAGAFEGSAVDLADGYIHFSTAAQVRETASKHFAGQTGLLLLTVDPQACPQEHLRWEPSRGGQLFPHLYTALDPRCVMRVDALEPAGGVHRFPDHVADE